MLRKDNQPELDDLHMALSGGRYIHMSHHNQVPNYHGNEAGHDHHEGDGDDDDDDDDDDDMNHHGVSAMTLTTLLHSGAEEVLNSLSAEQLLELGRNVSKLKKEKAPLEGNRKRKSSKASMTSPYVVAPLSSHSAAAAVAATAAYQPNTPLSKRGRMPHGSDVDVDIESPASASYYPSQQHQHPSSSYHSHDETGSMQSGDGVSTGASAAGLNLPASQPVTDVREGVEYLIFTYSTKGHIQEYTIRVDIDNVFAEDLPEDFRRENCVYPRACTSQDVYVGNRYEYETTVNDLAWRLTWLNADTLSGKRGLIQRAVDSYRNRFQESRSRRVIRQEKINNGTLRRRAIEVTGHLTGSHSTPTSPRRSVMKGTKPASSLSDSITISYEDDAKGGRITKAKVRLDIEHVDMNMIDNVFKANNSLFPQAYESLMTGTQNAHDEMAFFENTMNELGWKLAFLNPTKLTGKRSALLAAMEAFRERYDQQQQVSNQYDAHYHGHDGPMSEPGTHAMRRSLDTEEMAYRHRHPYSLGMEEEHSHHPHPSMHYVPANYSLVDPYSHLPPVAIQYSVGLPTMVGAGIAPNASILAATGPSPAMAPPSQMSPGGGYNMQLRPLQPVPMVSAALAPGSSHHYNTPAYGMPMGDLTPQQISTAAHLQHSPSSTLSSHSTNMDATVGMAAASHRTIQTHKKQSYNPNEIQEEDEEQENSVL